MWDGKTISHKFSELDMYIKVVVNITPFYQRVKRLLLLVGNRQSYFVVGGE